MQFRNLKHVGSVPLRGLVAIAILCQAGCVSLQKVASKPNQSHAQLVSHSIETCPLPDRRETLARLGARINPTRFVPERSQAWMWEQREKWQNRQQNFKDWMAKKKEEANQPPWPRFHPIPTKPVFEPDDQSPDSPPEVFGTFGKS